MKGITSPAAGVQHWVSKTLQALGGSPLPILFLIKKNAHANTRLIGLATAALAGGGPGEVSDGDYEEAVAGVGDTGKGVVPGSKGGQETEETTSLLDLGVGHVAGATLEVTDAEQQEGQVQEEEEQEESNG